MMLVSAKHHHESAIGIPMSFPSSSQLTLYPLQVVTEPQFEFPESHSKFSLAIYVHR